ncbi:MAG: hypothetical protein ACRDL6_12755 [Solirubrobacterales bacterium]
MKCPDCGNKARPGSYDARFEEVGVLGRAPVWRCCECGTHLVHGLFTRSRRVADCMLRADPEGFASMAKTGTIGLDLDRLRERLPGVSDEQLERIEGLFAPVADEEERAAVARMVAEERQRRS